MSFWTFYNTTSGRITKIILDANGPIDDLGPNEQFISGNYDTNTKYVLVGEITNRPGMTNSIDSPGGVGGTDTFDVSGLLEDTVVTYVDETSTPQTYTVTSDGLFSFGIAAPEDIDIAVTFELFPYLPLTLTASFTS